MSSDALEKIQVQCPQPSVNSSVCCLDKIAACVEYWNQICNCLVDSDDQVASVAFNAVRSLMAQHKSLQESDSSSPWSTLARQWHDLCFKTIHKNLTAVLHRCSRLNASGRVCSIRGCESVYHSLRLLLWKLSWLLD